MSATELADLLDPARDRLKLVTVAACWSAAVTAAEQRRQLGLPVPDQDDFPERDVPGPGTGTASSTGAAAGAVATQLTKQLGCAVLAMRYPVGDDFAMALAAKLYDLLARQGQPLPRAVGMTLRQLLAGTTYPALSAATPALFGDRAVDLRLAAPDRHGPADYGTAALKMAGFPQQPSRFVGRTAVMARSSAALAPESGMPGVLLHGMPGGGKTACATELAYGHEHAFDRLAWYKAPDEGRDISGALADFALTLERYLPGFQMAHVLASHDALARFAPRLTELAEQRRVLIVIDNAESLLTEGGRWRDERWGLVTGALVSHAGLGRVIMTSRRVPLGVTGLRAEAVNALSADEALLLASEFPHLRKLIEGQMPPLKPHVAKGLARRALNVAQGHPKLLDFADGQAASPARLAQLVLTADQAWQARGGVPEGFFTTGETTATADDYFHILAIWTKEVADTLTPGQRDLFWLLSCLEEPDRDRAVVDGNWASLWNRLGRDGEPPRLDQALPALAALGLAAIRAGNDDVGEAYTVHPGVARAGRDQAGKPFQDAVDAGVSQYWACVFSHATGGTDEVTDTALLVRAGLAEVPYLMRQEQWTAAAVMLERAFNRDPSRSNASAVLPAIAQIAGHEERAAGVLARVLMVIDPAAGEAPDARLHGGRRDPGRLRGSGGDRLVGGRPVPSRRTARRSPLPRRPDDQLHPAGGTWTVDPVARRGHPAAGAERDGTGQPSPRRGAATARPHGLPARHARRGRGHDRVERPRGAARHRP